MLLTLQIAHTVIALINFAALFYMIGCHWSGKRDGKLLKFCYFAIAVEAVAIIPFGFSCPIALYVKHNFPEGTRDILFPRAISKNLIEAGGWLFTIAMLPVFYRFFVPRVCLRERRRPETESRVNSGKRREPRRRRCTTSIPQGRRGEATRSRSPSKPGVLSDRP